jgi:hypothetical protein
MSFTIRQHAGAALVAAGIVIASLVDGLFDPVAFAVASVAVWTAVLAGLLSRSIPTAPVASLATIAGACLAGVVVLAAASIGWASDQGRAFEEAVRVSAYLGLFTLAACTASRRGRSEWIAGLTIGTAVVAALAVFSWLQPGALDERELAGSVPEAGGRLLYPIGYWNGLGALLAVAAVLLAHAGARAPDERLRSLALAAMPVPLLGIWFTTSRGAVAAVAVGLAALLLLSDDRPRQLLAAAIGSVGGGVALLAASRFDALNDGLTNSTGRAEGDWMTLILIVVAGATGLGALLSDRSGWRPSLPRRALAPVAAAGALILAAAVIAADPVERFEEFREPPPESETAGFIAAGSSDVSGTGRWQLWGEAVDAFESAPVAGLGAGGFEEYWAQNAPIGFFARDAHSLPMQQLAELGLAGAALLLGFVAAVALGAVRWLRGGRESDPAILVAVIAAGAVTAAIDWSWLIPAVLAPVAIASGLLVGSAPSARPQRDSYALGLVTVTLAWLAMMSAGLVVLTEVKLEQSRNAAADGRFDDAIDRALEARTVQPWSPEPYTQLALLEEELGNLDDALGRLEQAQERDSEDWRLLFTEARLHDQRGDPVSYRVAFDRARELNPQAGYLGGG